MFVVLILKIRDVTAHNPTSSNDTPVFNSYVSLAECNSKRPRHRLFSVKNRVFLIKNHCRNFIISVYSYWFTWLLIDYYIGKWELNIFNVNTTGKQFLTTHTRSEMCNPLSRSCRYWCINSCYRANENRMYLRVNNETSTISIYREPAVYFIQFCLKSFVKNTAIRLEIMFGA